MKNLTAPSQRRALQCKIYCYSQLPHASQIYTGFAMLESEGYLKLSYSLELPQHLSRYQLDYSRPSFPGVFAEIEGKLFFYDVVDTAEINISIAAITDFYFKRSFKLSGYAENKSHILPLGMNYEIYLSKPNIQEIRRLLLKRQHSVLKPKKLISASLDALGLTFLPRASVATEVLPQQKNRTVIFMARTWDPKETTAQLTEKEREERHSINEQRASTIKELKNLLGENFIGGFSKTEHSLRYYPSLIMNRPELSRKKAYMQLVKQTPICVATTGLHGSIGWKFAEYVALSRAIISEELNYMVPYGFEENKNYLTFSKNGSCAENVTLLQENPNKIYELMQNNAKYYTDYLRPDKLILNSLNQAFAFTE